VVNQSLVLRINICGENRHLRQARKRYRKPYDDSTNIKLTDMKLSFLDNKIERLTTRPTSHPDEFLFFPSPHFLFFNFMPTAHCTQLQAARKTNSTAKACNRVQSPSLYFSVEYFFYKSKFANEV
jgi:hypothetical protein